MKNCWKGWIVFELNRLRVGFLAFFKLLEAGQRKVSVLVKKFAYAALEFFQVYDDQAKMAVSVPLYIVMRY